METKFWTAHYLYQDSEGSTRTMTTEIQANDRNEAMAIAAKSPPGDEFVVTIHSLSDEQILDAVRLDALKKTGKETKDIAGFVAAWEAENPDLDETDAPPTKDALHIENILKDLLNTHKKSLPKKN